MGQYYEKLGIPVLSHVVASDFDVALCNTLLASNFIVQNHQHVPTVWWIHEPQFGLLYLKRESVAAEAFELATQIVFPTRWQAQTLYRPWLKGRTILCVPNGVDLPTSRPACPFENKERFFNLVQLGTVERRKGQDLTIKAIRQLDDPGLRVFFVGAFRDKSILDVASTETQRLVEVGSVQPESAAAYLHHCDALIFPTRDDLPSLAMMEAMWLGCCVISSDFGAIPELIEHGRTGLLFATGDSEAFAANIALIKRDAELRAHWGRMPPHRSVRCIALTGIGLACSMPSKPPHQVKILPEKLNPVIQSGPLADRQRIKSLANGLKFLGGELKAHGAGILLRLLGVARPTIAAVMPGSWIVQLITIWA